MKLVRVISVAIAMDNQSVELWFLKSAVKASLAKTAKTGAPSTSSLSPSDSRS